MEVRSRFRKIAAVLIVMAVGGQGCKKDDESLPASSVVFHLEYAVDSQSMLFDTLLYLNDAGNRYSINRLEYFLTQIRLVRTDGSEEVIKAYQYVNAADPATNRFSAENIPEGNYIGIRFNIGVDSAHNVTRGLPNNVPNNNMEWPLLMGGGYHFMKLEGHFLDQDTLYGYALHLGRNENRVEVEIISPLSFRHEEVNVTLVMNLNEWFRNPDLYDFTLDGNYSMSDSLAMHKLKRNGADVFTRRFQP